MDKITITEDFNKSYNELKSSLKDKCLNMLYRYIDNAREKATQLAEPLISNDILQLIDETRELKKYVKLETKKYFKSSEYVDSQQKLINLKDKLTTCDESEKEDLQKQISKSMAEIVTKNITIKNRYKTQNDKIKQNESVINAKMQEIDSDMQKIKEEVMDFLRDKIAICIKFYNDELNELNDAFKMPKLLKPEIPFDSNVIKLDVPIFSLTQPKDDDYDNYEKADRTIIASENHNTTKN